MDKDFDFSKLSESDQITVMGALDTLVWVVSNNIKLGGHTYQIKGHEYQADVLSCHDRVQVCVKGAQLGFHLDVNEPVPTPFGWKTMGSIKQGDQVFDDLGNICNVTAVLPIEYDLDCYQLIFSDGSKVIASSTHKWEVRNVKYNSYHTLTTEDIATKVRYRGGKRARYSIDVTKPLMYEKKKLNIDPYLLGLFLGDGSVSSGQITCDENDCDNYTQYLKSIGYDWKITSDKRSPNVKSLKIIPDDNETFHKKIQIFKTGKHIPCEYLFGSIDQRMNLLHGLIDSDGSINKKGSCFFYNTNYQLIQDTHELINSLGFKATIHYKGLNITGFGGIPRKSPPTKKWEIYFKADKSIPVAKLPRKFNRQTVTRRPKETLSRYIIDVKPVSSIPVRCIAVDSTSHLYLVGRSMIPTHNTELWVLQTLHGLIHGRYPQGSLYLFPTQNDVGDFSKARFDPLIESNACIHNYVNSTDSQFIKKIHDGFLYLRGARATKSIGGEKKSSAQLKSIPVDRIVFDERDEMSDDMVTLAEERVSHSNIQELMFLGTPTIPDIGVDAMYKKSTQNMWFLKCQHCGTETCLEVEFPNCIKVDVKDGRRYRACKKCDKEIFPKYGRWVPAFPERDITGWWISQLNSLYIDPGKIIDLYENPPNGDLSEVMNSKLGRAYIAQENRLTQNLVWGCCGQDYMSVRSDGPCFCGVDVGKKLHVVIGVRKTRELMKILHVSRIDDWNELHSLNSRFNVTTCVIDYKPEIHKVRDFQQQEPYAVYAADYVERKIGAATWDERDKTVKVNRTEICDATHDLVITLGRLELPTRNKEVEQYAFEMCNIAKKLEDDPFGGKVYRYRQLGNEISGPDHYRHATNYALLASERTGIESDNELINKYFKRKMRRSSSSWMSV